MSCLAKDKVIFSILWGLRAMKFYLLACGGVLSRRPPMLALIGGFTSGLFTSKPIFWLS